MIGGIFPNNDMSIFLTDENARNLDSRIIEGTLLRLKDKTRIPMELKKDEAKSDYGISVQESNTYRVFVSSRYYLELIETGHIGTRNPLGWGIKITKEGYAGRDSILNSELQLLKRFGKIM